MKTVDCRTQAEFDAAVSGGHKIVIKIKTPNDWCEYYGVEIKSGHALLYKGVESNWKSPRGLSYAVVQSQKLRIGTAERANAAAGYISLQRR